MEVSFSSNEAFYVAYWRHFGHAAISELSLLSGVKRKLDFEPAKGSFWRKAFVPLLQTVRIPHG